MGAHQDNTLVFISVEGHMKGILYNTLSFSTSIKINTYPTEPEADIGSNHPPHS